MSKQGHSQEQIDRKLKNEWKDTIVTDTRKNLMTTRLNVELKCCVKIIFKFMNMKVRILENELLIDKLRKENYKIKIK